AKTASTTATTVSQLFAIHSMSYHPLSDSCLRNQRPGQGQSNGIGDRILPVRATPPEVAVPPHFFGRPGQCRQYKAPRGAEQKRPGERQGDGVDHVMELIESKHVTASLCVRPVEPAHQETFQLAILAHEAVVVHGCEVPQGLKEPLRVCCI